MKEEVDTVLRALGDLLLQLGCDTGWLVPNTSLNSKQLNTSIEKYQLLLDNMELEIMSATAKAKERGNKAAQPEPEMLQLPTDEQPNRVDVENPTLDLDNLDEKFTDALGNGLSEEMDFYDMNRSDNLGMFGDVGGFGGAGMEKLDDDGGSYGMIDEYF